ncbi:hypothetical protein CKAN_02623600 [Cinnamomum micranthum f. kanehirae]|uniref:DUF761 domain-containing protein n=1 Tax=Cinnamomum micranthum f. kanehirae TaxID=337451 RepID=A0A3S3N6K3_9MAGN|nr:hypothetical protein CKAN_02623600 [Cinnamomum micranthum f. kanehirae]
MKLKKKLQPARKVWKGLTSKFQAKLLKLKPSKALKNTTLRLNTTMFSLLGRPHRSSPHCRPKKPPLSRPFAALGTRCRQNHSKFFDPVYIDDLFKEPVSVRMNAIEPAIRGNMGEKGAPSNTENGPCYESLMPYDEPIKDMELPMSREGENGTPSGAQELSEVDERAERFITEFRREMSLQRQRSFREYQEMLQRGIM